MVQDFIKDTIIGWFDAPSSPYMEIEELESGFKINRRLMSIIYISRRKNPEESLFIKNDPKTNPNIKVKTFEPIDPINSFADWVKHIENVNKEFVLNRIPEKNKEQINFSVPEIVM